MHERGGRRGRHVLEAEEQSGEGDKRLIDAPLESPNPLPPPKPKVPKLKLEKELVAVFWGKKTRNM